MALQHNFINTTWLQNTTLNPKDIINPKIQYNYSNNNYIPELLAYSVVVDGESLLEWCEYFGQPQVWDIHVSSSCGVGINSGPGDQGPGTGDPKETLNPRIWILL